MYLPSLCYFGSLTHLRNVFYFSQTSAVPIRDVIPVEATSSHSVKLHHQAPATILSKLFFMLKLA